MVLQVLGLSWDIIRTKLVKRVGEKVVAAAESSVDIIKKLVTEGPIALWGMIKEKAAEIKTAVMEGIRNWVAVELVKQGIIKLVSFLNPAGAIIQAILAIYNTIMFFVENWDRIVEFVKSIFNSIGDLAMGKLSAAAKAIERAMALTIPIMLGFLARFIGISGIGKTVKKIIMKIRKPIDKVVGKAIKFMVSKIKKLFGKGGKKKKKGDQKGGKKISKSINMNGKKHKLEVHTGTAAKVHFDKKDLPAQVGKTQKEVKNEKLKKELKGIEGKAKTLKSKAKSSKKDISKDASLKQLIQTIEKYAKANKVKDLQPPSGDFAKDVSKVKKSFKMDGASHTLFVANKGGKVQIEMASDFREKLMRKIDGAVEELRDRKDPDSKKLSGFLLGLKKDLIGFGEDLAALEINHHADPNLTIEKVEKEITSYGSTLQSIGSSFHLKSLRNIGHKSSYVEGGKIKQEYRSKIRKTFYPDFGPVYTSFRDAKLSVDFTGSSGYGLRDPNNPAHFISQGSLSDEQAFYPGATYKSNINGTDYPSIPRGKASLDHKGTSVSEHWNTKSGNNTTQETRKTWYRVTSNLEVISDKLNSSRAKKEKKYEPDVGADFRGPGEH